MQIDHVRALAQRVEECFRAGDVSTGKAVNAAFHDYLMAHCGNPLSFEIYKSHGLRPSIPRSSEFDQQIKARIPEQQREKPSLLEVVEAIAAHDQDRAEQLVSQKIRVVTDALRKTLWEPGKA